MTQKLPAGPAASLPDTDLIAIGGVYLRLSAICYAQPVAGGLIVYLNHGRLHFADRHGADQLKSYLDTLSRPIAALGGSNA